MWRAVCGSVSGLALVVLVAGCPPRAEIKPEQAESADAGTGPSDAGPDAGATGDTVEVAGLEPVERPVFSPDRPQPCDSHTACYLRAKEAHASGERAGYLLALENCEYYRGRYQLEKFYGLCLLILADAYRHLDNFTESQACYQRFLDTRPEDTELALQARASLEEVRAGAATPLLYRDYLRALSMLTRYNRAPDEKLLVQAREILARLQAEHPDWALSGKVGELLERLDAGQKQAPPPSPQASPTE